jgi:hypothetical protein
MKTQGNAQIYEYEQSENVINMMTLFPHKFNVFIGGNNLGLKRLKMECANSL